MDISIYSDIHASIFAYNQKKAENMTFAAWHSRARRTREALAKLREDIDAEISGMVGTWADRVIDERRASYADSFQKVSEDAKKRIVEDLDAVIESKRAQLSEAMGNPGSEAVNILTLLNLRTKVSAADIAAVVPKMAHSLLALQTLREIAERNNVAFPHLPDSEEFERDVAYIREQAVDMVSTIINDDADGTNYLQRLFWSSDSMGRAQQAADRLDSTSYLHVDASKIGVSQPSNDATAAQDKNPTSGGKDQPAMWSLVELNGTEYVQTIARQFHTTVDAIQEANGGLDLLHTHPGQKILVPSTRLKVEAGNGHVQESQVTLVPAPTAEA